jgi:hypothetical protein
MPRPACSLRIVSMVNGRRRLRISATRATAEVRFQIPPRQTSTPHVVKHRIDGIRRLDRLVS